MDAYFHLGTGVSYSVKIWIWLCGMRYYEEAVKKYHIQSLIHIATILVCGLERLIDTEYAVKCLLVASEPTDASSKGNAEAQNMLGELYETGEGTPADVGPDLEKAVYYYKHAIFNLGCLYEQGLGVPQDFTLMLKLYREVNLYC